jgi:SAM-dependent methyltransferase
MTRPPRRVSRATPRTRSSASAQARARPDVDAGSREHYEDAELYDHEYRRRRADVAFYRRLARRELGGPGHILELGCGTGRLTLPLARDGHHVTAVDAAPAMLARLRARLARSPAAIQDRVQVLAGDLRDFTVPGRPRFALAIAAFNVLEHLYTRVELAACLAAVRRHLVPGGAFAFDVQMPDLAWLLRDPARRWARTRFTHPRTGERLWYSTNHDYDPVSQIALIRIYYDPVDGGPGRVVQLSQRKYFPAELEALLAASGFVTAERWGDFLGQPLGPAAESQVILARVSTETRP